MDQQEEDESNVNNNNENQLNSQDVNPVAEMEDMKKDQINMNMKNGGQDDDNEEYDDDIVQESGSGNFKNSVNNINEFKNVDQYNSNEFNVNTKQNDIDK